MTLTRFHTIKLGALAVSVMVVATCSLTLPAPSRAALGGSGASATPTLSQLPGALAEGHLPLTIVLP
ncbi:MAG: hypothetical protein J2P28_26345, partial [Actinobacteria bacterium]|nr:hypothetical protein [Actinomycetota bacterium]